MSTAPIQTEQQGDLPIIGITTYGRDEDNKFSLPGEYVDAVRRAGGLPLLLPPGEQALHSLLKIVDGLILAGGGDLDPTCYNGRQHKTIYMLDAERDSFELDMAQQVIQSDLPTLGICRGAQVINVAMGGTLIEHLPDEVGESILHRLPPRQPATHAVSIDAGSELAKILQVEETSPRSWHHQAIREVAPGLDVVARAADGTVEAAEMANHPWLLVVQWHPELTAAEDPIQQRLFDAFVDACRDPHLKAG